MTNEQMKAGRFLKLAKGRKMFRFIVANLEAGNTVWLRTYTRATKYSAKHKAMFKLGASGSVYVQRGKAWDCIDLSGVTAQGDADKLLAA